MATNPNRPQYQDTIESTWGQAVADHVVRRYATQAERDADLAGFTADDLTGQLVAVGDGALMLFNGTAWLPIFPNVESQAGSSVATTDSNGNAVIPFPRPFSITPTGVIAAEATGYPDAFVCQVFPPGQFAGWLDVNQFQVRVWRLAGAVVVPSATLSIHWHAFAVWTPGAATRPADELLPPPPDLAAPKAEA